MIGATPVVGVGVMIPFPVLLQPPTIEMVSAWTLPFPVRRMAVEELEFTKIPPLVTVTLPFPVADKEALWVGCNTIIALPSPTASR